MNFAASLAEPPPNLPPNPAAEAADAARTARQLAIIAELTDMAVDLARAAYLRAKAIPAAANDAAYNRIARAVERALALESWITQRRTARAADHALRKAHADRLTTRARRRRLREDVEATVACAPGFTQRHRNRLERYLEDYDATGDLTRPIAEILQDICQTLGLTPPNLADFIEPLAAAKPIPTPTTPHPTTITPLAPAPPPRGTTPAPTPPPSG